MIARDAHDEGLTIRAARSSDLEVIVPLAISLGRLHEEFDPARFTLAPFGATAPALRSTYRAFFAEQLHNPDAVVLIASLHGAHGYAFGRLEAASFLDLSDAAGWIHDVFVEPAGRARRIATHLMAHLTAALRGLGATQIKLAVSPRSLPARRMFERRGFVETMTECRLDARSLAADGGDGRATQLASAPSSPRRATIRSARLEETDALLGVGVATQLFDAAEAKVVLGGVLDALHAGQLQDEHLVCVAADAVDGSPLGWAYASADSHASRVWELWWIGVTPADQARGLGDQLLRYVEAHVRERGCALLLIATSSLPALGRTRQFYARRGYVECGRVPGFYAEGDDKVMFAKRMIRADDVDRVATPT